MFLNLTSCTVTITSAIMFCTEVCGHLVMSFITIKSLHIDLLIHIFGWYADVLWAQLVCTVTITSVIMCCTEVCSHVVMCFITIKSLHTNLIYSFIFLGGMQMFCWHNWFIVLIRWWAELFCVATWSFIQFQYIINTFQISKFLPGIIRCPMRFIEFLPKDAPIVCYFIG